LTKTYCGGLWGRGKLPQILTYFQYAPVFGSLAAFPKPLLATVLANFDANGVVFLAFRPGACKTGRKYLGCKRFVCGNNCLMI